jgi:hypothetical protein
MRTFRYLGSLINYSLRDDDDITAQIASATTAMGALKKCGGILTWTRITSTYSFELFQWTSFSGVPKRGPSGSHSSINSRFSSIVDRSIWRILQISMSTVKEKNNRNKRVREMFYSIPCVWNMIAARQTDFIGKMMCGPPDWPSLNMITACCDHKQQVGRPQTTGKIFMVENLRLLFRDVNTVHINRFGSLWDWINEASRLLEPTCQTPSSSWHAATRATRNVGTVATVARTTSC